jgi:hypothetical protein
LATFKTNLAALITSLSTLEADRDLLYNLGAGDVADWLALNIEEGQVGWQPRVSSSGGVSPQVRLVQAPSSAPRDLTTVDQRPISTTATGAWAGLS